MQITMRRNFPAITHVVSNMKGLRFLGWILALLLGAALCYSGLRLAIDRETSFRLRAIACSVPLALGYLWLGWFTAKWSWPLLVAEFIGQLAASYVDFLFGTGVGFFFGLLYGVQKASRTTPAPR